MDPVPTSSRLIAVVVTLLVSLSASRARAADAPLTFTRDIAPLVYQHCSTCHRPGAPGPFDLLTYDDVRRHLRQSLKVLDARVMPPWLPEPGFGEFAGDRRLDDQTIATFRRWADQGAPEGDPADLPPKPPSATGWTLGKPDLILKLEKPYTLAPEGPDLYRNFVLPTGLDSRRFVRAAELHAGNARALHHGFLQLNQTGAAARRSAREGGAGYDAMDPGDDVYAPEGQNVSWQPGKATVRTDQFPWLLPPDADVVLQAHLRRTGKPEQVQPEVGLYFTDKPPAGPHLMMLLLRSTAIDIPAGAADHAVESAYTLPVDAEALMISAHAHYLGRDVHGYADLPDGRRVELLRIKRWNFNMQDAYTFREPVRLPKGSRLHMRWTFDNSGDNPANPSAPPRRVLYGENSTDEMAELSMQLRVSTPADFDLLRADYARNWLWPDAVECVANRIKRRPDDATLHVDLAKLFLKAGRRAEVAGHLNAAFKLDPKCPQAHYVLASWLAQQGDYAHAAERYRKSLDGDPDNFRARADLALALGLTGKLPEAVEEFTAALRLNPRDPLTHANLGKIYALQGKPAEARAEFDRALQLDPDHAIARDGLKALGAAKEP